MPQVFSGGWLYLFLIVMVICIVRIWMKVRTIQQDGPMDRPVIKVAPVPQPEPDPDSESRKGSILSGPDDLIKQGEYKKALKSLKALLEDLSPTEDRESRGMALFRIAACHSRLATGDDRFQYLVRAGEALRESVRLFTPARYRNHYLRALGELAGLYEDLARGKNPVENLNQSARTCETAAASAREGGLVLPEAMFLTRMGHAYRQLASYGEPRINLRKAIEVYEKAGNILEKDEDESTISGRMKILAVLGDVYRELARYFQKEESLAHSVSAYEGALELMDEEEHFHERCVVLINCAGVLLELYDMEKSPAHLRQALRYSRDALDSAKGETNMVTKGLAMAVMGDALTRYAESKGRRENLERAVKLYETALGLIKDGEEPARREMIKESLAETVGKIGETS